MKKLWNIEDLIDLEFFLYRDKDKNPESLTARDRQIYNELPETVKKTASTPSELLRFWLSARRKTLLEKTDRTTLPGRICQEILCFFFGAALLTGLLSGSGVAFSFLSYSGKEPVNVAAYFSVFVLAQILLLLLLACSFLFRRLQGRSPVEASLLYRLLRHLFTGLLHKVTTRIQKRASGKISAETHLEWSAYINSFNQIRQRYLPIFLRPFFLVAQTFGVCFNIGVLTATLFKVIGADLAFGWQSTLQVTSVSVNTLVHWMALPWSWLPNTFTPTLSQIEGSRLVLKEGIYHLINEDLTSWWPFLCLSVLCYGLLPRLTLLLIFSTQQYRDLAALDFQQGYFRRILHRMRTPQVSTAARTESKQASLVQPTPLAGTTEAEAAGSHDTVQNTETPIRDIIPQPPDTPPAPIPVLIPDELLSECSFDDLEQQVRQHIGQILSPPLPFWTLEQSEEEELTALQTVIKQDKSSDVLVLLEAWQPPIEELLSWLGLLRQTIGKNHIIFLALTGKPNSETILTPVQAQHLQIWHMKTATLGDPGLQIIELVKL